MKSFYTAVISVFLIILTVFVCRNYVNIKEDDGLENILAFQIENNGKTETIHLWINDEGEGFVFLPSYAKLENTHISLKDKIRLDGSTLADGDSLQNIELGKEYVLTFDGEKEEYPIQFLQSANVATMYVNAEQKEIERIYANKSNRAKACIALYTSGGDSNYSGLDDNIKCRGNATFNAAKKPFSIDLEQPSDLLGMGSAKKWVLLANAYDVTNLKNKIVLDFAKCTSLKWTPDCEYVDLYINGEYNGLYLLSEKVEIGENRLNIDYNNGFLCKNEPSWRFDQLQNPVVTDYGRLTEITSPNSINTLQKRKIKDDIQLMEDEIMAGPLGSLTHIDLDSWVSKYLIDEITENIDADFCSSYFYCRYENGEPRFYGGPIWDYDMTFGSSPQNANPSTFVANRKLKTRENQMPYYYALYRNEIFYNRLVELYKEQIFEKVIKLIEVDIEKQEKIIKKASYQNKIRWHNRNTEDNSSKIREYLEARIDFLNKVWIDNEEYCIVQIETGIDEVFESYAVLKGKSIIDCPEFKTVDTNENILIDSNTGEVFDFEKPIFKDIELYKSSNKKFEVILIEGIRHIEGYILYILLIIFGMVLLLLTVRYYVLSKRR